MPRVITVDLNDIIYQLKNNINNTDLIKLYIYKSLIDNYPYLTIDINNSIHTDILALLTRIINNNNIVIN